MTAARQDGGQTGVLIAGGGPIGLALAAELGRRGIRTILVDDNPEPTGQQQPGQAKMIVVSMRTMEFCRQLGLSAAVRDWGFPAGHGLDSVFVTSLPSYELGRVRTPRLADRQDCAYSPERDRPCPQTWFDPILRSAARSAGSVELRFQQRLDSFVQDEDGVTARVIDLTTTRPVTIRASYLVGCDGYHSIVRNLLGIVARGEPHLDLSMSVYLRIPDLLAYHDKGDAYRYVAVGAEGVWAVLTTIDGRDLYRLQLIGANDIDVRRHDLHQVIRRLVGAGVRYDIEEISLWERKMTVADRFGDGRVFIAGDAAHAHPPNGGLGMNTGIPDAWDLGWKLAAVLQGWGGATLLDAYDIERRPACHRAAAESLRNYHRLVDHTRHLAIDADTEEGKRLREQIGRRLVAENERAWNPVGIHLGYLYHPSPLVIDDGSAVPADDPYGYTPSPRPGARAPHIWLAPGESILDRFGPGFSLLDFGAEDENAARLVGAAARRGVPLRVHRIGDPAAAELYERKLVLVRPDGHVAWRSDRVPANALRLVDVVRGAGPRVAARRACREPASTVPQN